MIAGIGIDIVDVSRIDTLMRKHGPRFLERILTSEEMAFCASRHDSATCIAGRFAAKEAAFKALSCGRSSGITFKDIRVVTGGESPRLILAGKARARADQLEVGRSHLSISHDRGCAVAIVILETA